MTEFFWLKYANELNYLVCPCKSHILSILYSCLIFKIALLMHSTSHDKCKLSFPQHRLISYPFRLVLEFPWITPSGFAIGTKIQSMECLPSSSSSMVKTFCIIFSQRMEPTASLACCRERTKMHFWFLGFVFFLRSLTMYIRLEPSLLPISSMSTSQFLYFRSLISAKNEISLE